MRVYYGDSFSRCVKKLGWKQQDKLAELIVLLSQNPFHQQLHVKSLEGNLAGLYSFRIARDVRVLFKFLSPDEIILVDLGHRRDIYR